MKGINVDYDNRPEKIKNITNQANTLLEWNLNEKEIIQNFKNVFDKLVRFWKFFIKKIENEKDFEEFLIWFENIFKDLEIEKLYNSTNSWNLSQFDKMNLFMQFFYISTPLKNSENFDFIKWWVCYHWALFYKNLFEEIDMENKLEKKLVSFLPKFQHWVFSIWFWDKEFIIDPYSKWDFLKEVKKWNEIYLGAINSELLFWKVKNNDTLIYWEKELNLKKFENDEDFIEDVYLDELINIKTYLNWNIIHLIVKDLQDEILINLNWNQFIREKEFSLTDMVWLYLEWKKIDNYKLLISLLWFDENIIDKKIKNQIKIIANKINMDSVIEKLWIKEEIEMFK